MVNKVSIAMCTYNGARFLGEQLASFATQTRAPDEVVICDDCSTDATAEIVRDFKCDAPFDVRFYVNERRLGSTKNFEKAISLCAGDVIALSDQDDVWAAEKLERLEQVFSSSPWAGLVFTDAEVVDESLQPLGMSLWQFVGFGATEQSLVRRGCALDLFLPGWTATGATMAFRAGFRGLVLPIPDDLAMIHDGWCALIIAAVARVEFVAEPLVRYRQHALQQVGAKEARSSSEPPLRRVNTYDGLIRITRAAIERLSLCRTGFDCEQALARLHQWLAHLEARSKLPRARLLRTPRVLKELLTLRYHRFSKGFRSAAKDILSGSQGSPSA